MKGWILAIMTAVTLSGCSVYMAASSDEKKDLGILAPGTSRDLIIAEFGMPLATMNEAAPAQPTTEPTVESGSGALPAVADTHTRHDIFKFTQGRSTASNAGRAVFYGAAAVFTLGLSEVIATPLESAVGDQGEIRLRTSYDANWRLTTSEILDEGAWISIPEYNQRVLERENELNSASGATSN